MDDGKIYNKEEEIYEVFNKFFQSVFTKENVFEADASEQLII